VWWRMLGGLISLHECVEPTKGLLHLLLTRALCCILTLQLLVGINITLRNSSRLYGIMKLDTSACF